MSTYPANTIFRWDSGVFLATLDGADSTGDAIRSALAPKGVDLEGGVSGGGWLLPMPTTYSGLASFTSPRDSDTVRLEIETAFKNAFSFVGNPTRTWEAAGVNGNPLTVDTTPPTVGGAISDFEEAAGQSLDYAYRTAKRSAEFIGAGAVALSVAIVVGVVAFLYVTRKVAP